MLPLNTPVTGSHQACQLLLIVLKTDMEKKKLMSLVTYYMMGCQINSSSKDGTLDSKTIKTQSD